MSQAEVAYIGGSTVQAARAQVGYIGGSASLLIADAGPDKTVRPLDTVPLTPAGTVGTFTQVSGTSVTINGVPPFQSYTAPADIDGTVLVFELAVTDGVSTATDQVTHTVLPHQSWQVVSGVLQPISRFYS